MSELIETRKQPWQKPELIVLVRTRPEEAVLRKCDSATDCSEELLPS